MAVCSNCKAESADTSRFCDSCGTPLSITCDGCQTRNRFGAAFCNQCGQPLTKPAAPPPLRAVAIEPEPAPEPLDEGTRKLVTILFADVRGSTQMISALDPEAAMHRLDPAIQAMTDAVHAAGGIVNRVEGDGVMAMFGAPHAREDHAIRACLAARAILDQAARSDPSVAVRVGMASGEVVIRPTGRDAADWDAVGITPHLARRLEQFASPGTALLPQSTARLVRGFADLLPTTPVEVRGIDEPVPVFELLTVTARPAWEVRAAAHPLNTLVGRETELAQLAAAAARAALGRGRVVTVVGDAGLGKSRLVHEFLRGLPTGAWHVLRISAFSHGIGAAYHLAAELLRAWLNVEISDDQAEVERKLDQAMALQGSATSGPALDAVPLRSLLDLPIDDAGWAALDLAARRSRVVAALRLVILREAALHPLLMVVEDLHWADQPSVELLDAIVDGLGASRMLVLATTRPPAPGESRHARWMSRSYGSELHLHPLEPEQADALLSQLVGAGDALASLRQRIVSQADGTPLFLEEIARSLNERGLIVTEPSRTVAMPKLADMEIPASVQSVLAERIDRLPPGRRRLLQFASVIGKDFPLALLRRVTDASETSLREELAELQEAEFIYELNLPSGIEYTFKHALTQAVAYEGILRRRRRELHARTLAAMEELYADRLDEMIERLAEHALKGEQWESAYTYALRGGKRASARSAWREAVTLLDRAAEALSRLPQTPEIIGKAIEVKLDLRVALAPIGEVQRIGESLKEARDFAGLAGDGLKIAQIDTSRCMSFSLLGNLDEAVEVGRNALATASSLDDPGPMLNAAFALGQAYWYRGDVAEAEAVLVQLLPHVRGGLRVKRTGTTGTASVLHLVCLSKTYALSGDFDRAAELAAEAVAVADDTKRPYDLAYSRVATGFHHYMRGDHHSAVAELEAGLAISRRAEIRLLVSSIARYLGRSYVLVGRPDDAKALLTEAIQQSKDHGLIAFRAWCEAALALTHLPDTDKAAAALAEVLEFVHAHGYRPVEVDVLRMMGNLLSQGERPDREQAESLLRRSIALGESLNLRPQAAEAKRDLAQLLGTTV